MGRRKFEILIFLVLRHFTKNYFSIFLYFFSVFELVKIAGPGTYASHRAGGSTNPLLEKQLGINYAARWPRTYWSLIKVGISF